MCDYSLMGVPNRLAQEGEELIVYSFQTGSRGLTSPAELAPPTGKVGSLFWEELKSILRIEKMHPVGAVCIPPGARLTLRDIPSELQSSIGVRSIENVTFTQLDMAENRHRDAVRFNNGFEMSLQRLTDGQRVTVISLSFETADDLNPENRERVAQS